MVANTFPKTSYIFYLVVKYWIVTYLSQQKLKLVTDTLQIYR
jgi:hypothetical protein